MLARFIHMIHLGLRLVGIDGKEMPGLGLAGRPEELQLAPLS